MPNSTPISGPSQKQIHGPSNANLKDYGKMIADLGGADVCCGGIGWSGHIAYIEPGSAAFAASSLEEWKKMEEDWPAHRGADPLQHPPELPGTGVWAEWGLVGGAPEDI